jgi:hypothetical protein
MLDNLPSHYERQVLDEVAKNEHLKASFDEEIEIDPNVRQL